MKDLCERRFLSVGHAVSEDSALDLAGSLAGVRAEADRASLARHGARRHAYTMDNTWDLIKNT
jgi:hypothetical protein